MNCVAAKISKEVRMFFKYDGFDSRATKKVAEHHARGTAAHDAALGDERFVRFARNSIDQDYSVHCRLKDLISDTLPS